MGEKIAYDNDVIRAIDEAMDWVEEDGSCPSKTADDHGYDCRFLDGAFSATAWRERATGLWSACVLNQRGIATTLLAKSFTMLERLYRKLCERGDAGISQENSKRWNPYYSAMWERRYTRWCCKASVDCDCQLCRIRRGREKREVVGTLSD